MSRFVQLGSEENGTMSLYDLLEAALHFDGKPAPFCSATSASTRGGNLNDPPALVLTSIVPVPELVDQVCKVIEPELRGIVVPANSQFVAIVHPASTTLPFKRLHHLEKDNESQFEQENLAPFFKIMGYHLASKQIREETGTQPEHAAVFKLWASSDFQKSSFQFFASSSKSATNITDFEIYSALSVNARTRSDFAVKAVIEVKTTKVLTDTVIASITGWYKAADKTYVPGLAIQYVWPERASSKSTDDAGGSGQVAEKTRDKIRVSGVDVNGVSEDTIETPALNKAWWNALPLFEASGIRPATLPAKQWRAVNGGQMGRNWRKRPRPS